MNEEALNAAYQHFTGGGYSGNIEDFKNLISTNNEAFTTSFNNFKNGGYKGSTEDFSKLIGVELGKDKRCCGSRCDCSTSNSTRNYGISIGKWFFGFTKNN